MRHVGAVASAVLVWAGLAVPAVAAVSPAPPPDVRVMLPELTRFNPDTTDYVVRVESDTDVAGIYAVVDQGPPQELEVPGDTTIAFPDDGEPRVRVLYCESASACGAGCSPYDPACSVLATSPTLGVYRSLHVYLSTFEWDGLVGHDTLKQVEGAVAPAYGGETPEVTWAVTAQRTPDSPALSSGPVPSGGGGLGFTYDLPEDIASGKYWLRVSAHRDYTEFGELSGVSYLPMTVDTLAPRGTMLGDRTTIYPARDHYLDEAEFELRTDDEVVVRGYEVRDLRGRLVLREVMEPWVDPWDDSGLPPALRSYRDWWDGRLPYRVVPGTYLFRWVGFDGAENEAVTKPIRVRVSDHRLRKLTWSRTFPAARTVVDTQVGACSTVRRPATRGWKGSVGYLSQTRCRRESDSVAATTNLAYLPRAISNVRGGRYLDLKLSLFGGGVAGRRSAYVVMNTLRSRHESVHTRAQFGPRLGWHSLAQPSPDDVVRDRGERAYLVWQTGLTGGARYDVKSFRITVTYSGLGPP